HAHESPAVMTVPLMVLAVGALFLGLVIGPTELLSHFLSFTQGLTPAAEVSPNYLLMLCSSAFALGGLGVAWWMYVKQPGMAGRLAGAVQGLYQASLNKFYLDELYGVFFVKPLEWLAWLVGGFDWHGIDGLVDLVGQVPRWLGTAFRPVQNGLVQFY